MTIRRHIYRYVLGLGLSLSAFGGFEQQPPQTPSMLCDGAFTALSGEFPLEENAAWALLVGDQGGKVSRDFLDAKHSGDDLIYMFSPNHGALGAMRVSSDDLTQTLTIEGISLRQPLTENDARQVVSNMTRKLKTLLIPEHHTRVEMSFDSDTFAWLKHFVGDGFRVESSAGGRAMLVVERFRQTRIPLERSRNMSNSGNARLRVGWPDARVHGPYPRTMEDIETQSWNRPFSAEEMGDLLLHPWVIANVLVEADSDKIVSHLVWLNNRHENRREILTWGVAQGYDVQSALQMLFARQKAAGKPLTLWVWDNDLQTRQALQATGIVKTEESMRKKDAQGNLQRFWKYSSRPQ